MINTQPFHDKLDKLLEYMFIKINGHGKIVSINIEALPAFEWNPEKFFELVHTTGIMMFNSNDPVPELNIRQLTFEEYCNETSLV